MSTANKLISASGGSTSVGEHVYTTTGLHTWTCPQGVTSVSVVCVGAGKGYPSYRTQSSGGGGGLGYKNNITVSSGTSYTVSVGESGTSNDSYFINVSTVKGGTSTGSTGGTYTGDGGGDGGDGNRGAGGGAGGYSGVLMVRLAQVALAAEEVAAPLKMLGRQIKDTHPFVAVAAAVAV
jgi:hypothetical protein